MHNQSTELLLKKQKINQEIATKKEIQHYHKSSCRMGDGIEFIPTKNVYKIPQKFRFKGTVTFTLENGLHRDGGI